MSATAHDLLVRGLNRIHQHGHVKGLSRYGKSPCAATAITARDYWQEGHGSETERQAFAALVQCIPLPLDVDARAQTVTWNDTPGTTQGEIEQALERAVCATAPPPRAPFPERPPLPEEFKAEDLEEVLA